MVLATAPNPAPTSAAATPTAKRIMRQFLGEDLVILSEDGQD
jgi:hypothetical protein